MCMPCLCKCSKENASKQDVPKITKDQRGQTISQNNF